MQQPGSENFLKPTIYWILQKNHVTPFIVDYLNFFRSAAPNVNIKFLIPSLWTETIDAAKDLNPETFIVRTYPENNYEWYCRKRDSLSGIEFSEGLSVWRTLVLDDLHGGIVNVLTPELPEDPTLQFLIMQLPIPLGSFGSEEGVFHALLHWARERKIPTIGYELLPFDTRWTMMHALVDGVITTNQRSYDWLTSDTADLNTKIWLLPRYERRIFSPSPTFFWRNGIMRPHDNRLNYNIPDDKTILYIPHNVATLYEYRHLISVLSKRGDEIHLMISIGEDQARGTDSHREIVETLSKDALSQFHSVSFHDLNKTTDMVCADAVIACSSCHQTDIATLNSIPTLILDPYISESHSGNTRIVNDSGQVDAFVSGIIEAHGKITSLGDIFSKILSVTMNDPNRKAGHEFEF